MTNANPATEPDTWIPITELSPALRDLTGNPGPGYRRLSTLAADGKITPPMEKQGGRFWGCYRSKLTELAKALGEAASRPICVGCGRRCVTGTGVRQTAVRRPVLGAGAIVSRQAVEPSLPTLPIQLSLLESR
jgi:hypothetical protein